MAGSSENGELLGIFILHSVFPVLLPLLWVLRSLTPAKADKRRLTIGLKPAHDLGADRQKSKKCRLCLPNFPGFSATPLLYQPGYVDHLSKLSASSSSLSMKTE